MLGNGISREQERFRAGEQLRVTSGLVPQVDVFLSLEMDKEK